jgi:hypothetical protein
MTICFINRKEKREEFDLAINNISEEYEYLAMQPFPDYHYILNPYVLIKDKSSLNVINVRTM